MAAPAERVFWTRKLQGVSATRLPRWHSDGHVAPGRRFG
jgi:hypothetical protein